MPTPSSETEFAIRAAKAAGKILLEGFGTRMRIEHKRREIDLVTEFDRRSDECILGRIRRSFPDHRILSEESGQIGGGEEERKPIWMVDPLDGTTNFAHGLPIFSVSIALREGGRTKLGVVYDPTRKEIFWAERGKGAFCGSARLRATQSTDLRSSLLVTGFPYDAWSNPQNNLDLYARFAVRSRGVRRLGSAALDLAYVGAGRFDGYWEMRLSPWDVAAGGLIAEEAGARVTAMDGVSDYLAGEPSLIAANPILHGKMLAVILGGD
ncbi:MAG: inositol monophosphatase [Anaerolineales bacterium]|nr:inositol monophosphatase [Anaerolineales bacterium]